MALRDQPYIPLYIQDIMTDEKLNECCAATHGIYIKGIMCLMHKSSYYGKILLKQKYKQTESKPRNFAVQLDKHMPYTVDEIEKAIIELIKEEVCYFEGDYLCQKRMIKDGDISEKRSNAAKKGGGNPNFAKTKAQTKKQTKGQTNSEDENETEFEFKNEDVFKEIERIAEDCERRENVKYYDLQFFNIIGEDEEKKDLWQWWLNYKADQGEPIKDTQVNSLLRKFKDSKNLREDIETATAAGWKGFGAKGFKGCNGGNGLANGEYGGRRFND